MLFKAKKYVASKMTETKSGRSLIVAHFGEAGDAILLYLKYSARKFSDKQTARDLKKDMLKLIAKSVLLYTNKVVTAVDATPARGPTLACMSCISDALERCTTGGSYDVDEVAKAIRAAHDALLPLLKPHVREHNWQRLTRVLGYYGDPRFVKALLTDEAYEVERLKLCAALKRLTRPFETELRATSEFQARRLRSRADGLKALVEAPTLMGFMKHDVGMDVFGKWLQESDPPGRQLLEFAYAVEYYKSTANPRLRPTRATQIRTKFVDAASGSSIAATPLFETLRADCAGRLDAATSAKPPPRDVFAKLEAQALAQLDQKFTTAFVASAVFADLEREHASLDMRALAAERALTQAKSIEDNDDDDDDDTIHHSDGDN